MLRSKDKKNIRTILNKHFNTNNVRFFVFGSSVKQTKFNDIDIGIIGTDIKNRNIYLAKNELEQSTIPYHIDLINFNNVDKSFKDNIFKKPIIWLT